MEFGHGHRGVRLVPAFGIGRLPACRAGRAIDPREQHFLAADGQHRHAILDQRALPRVPERNARAVPRHEVDRPEVRARDGIQGAHLALRSERHQKAPVERAHGTGDAVVALGMHRIKALPDLGTVGQREAAHQVAAAGLVVVQQVDAPVAHDGAGVAVADGDAPAHGGAAGGPGFGDRHAGAREIVTREAAEGRPGAARLARRAAAGGEEARRLRRGWPGGGGARLRERSAGRRHPRGGNRRQVGQPPGEGGARAGDAEQRQQDGGGGAHQGRKISGTPTCASQRHSRRRMARRSAGVWSSWPQRWSQAWAR